MKLRNFLLVPALAVTMLTMAACGGDDDDDAGTDPTATTAATSTSDEATTASGTSTSAPTTPGGDATTEPTTASGGSPTSTGGNSGDGNLTGSGADELRALAADLSKKTYTVTYEFTEGTEDDLTTGSLTLYQKPPKSATSYSTDAEVFTIIDDGVNSWICSKNTGDEEGSCLKSETTGSLTTAAAFDLDSALDDLEFNLNVTEEGDEKIGGRDAACFTIEEEGFEESRACFDKKDGFLLLLDQTDDAGGKYEIRATNVSNSVDDSVFEPMYPETELP